MFDEWYRLDPHIRNSSKYHRCESSNKSPSVETVVISQSLEISEKTNLKVTNCDSKPIEVLTKLRKFWFCSNENLQRVKAWVSKRFWELAQIRYGKNDFYNYSVLRRIYFNAKSKLIGFAKNNSKKALSKQVQILQRKIRLATVL